MFRELTVSLKHIEQRAKYSNNRYSAPHSDFSNSNNAYTVLYDLIPTKKDIVNQHMSNKRFCAGTY